MAEPTGGEIEAGPPKPQAAVFGAWGPTVEQLSKYVVLASILTYVLGYVVAAYHYSSTGVPATELSHNTFVGAGLLFAAATALAYLALQAMRFAWELEKERSTPRKVLSAGLVYSGFAIVGFGVAPVAGLPGLVFQGYFLLSVLTVAFLEYTAKRKGRRMAPLAFVYIIFANVLGSFFASYVFPLALPELGGGRPVFLFAWNRGEQPPKEAPASVAALRCSELGSTSAPACTVVSLVYTSASHLYFAVEERATPCGEIATLQPWPVGRGWVTRGLIPLKRRDTKFCFARVADSDVKTLLIRAR